MEQTKFTLEELNKIAAVFSLELVEMNNYYYWWGTNHEIRLLVCRLENYAINIPSFSQLNKVEWLKQLKSVVNEIIDMNNK